MSSSPALVAISHGTSSPAGQAAVLGLVAAVARRLPEVTVRLGHVDVQQPDVAASLDALPDGQPVVIVPLLLSAGYHVRIDLKKQSAGHDAVTIAPALGPDPRLAEALAARLDPIGLRPDDVVVLAVAGSSDERANDDCRETARMLAERLDREVAIGFLAAAEPRLDAAVEAARASTAGRVVVATYLLAPGYFHDLAVRLAAGAEVASPLLVDHAQHHGEPAADEPTAVLVDIVVERYRAALGGRASQGSSPAMP